MVLASKQGMVERGYVRAMTSLESRMSWTDHSDSGR